MRALVHFRPTDPVEQILEVYARDGVAVIDDLASDELVTALARDFEPHLARTPWCNRDVPVSDDLYGRKTKRLHGLLARSARYAEVLVFPLIHRICERLLGPHARDFRVSTGEIMALGEGQPRQQLHRDADTWPHVPAPRPEILVNTILALTDFTNENGATVVAPGSHVWPAQRAASEAELTCAAMRRGSVVVYSGNLIHGGGANTTPATRVGLYTGYLLGWLRPMENHTLTNGVEALRRAPERVQTLLGYTEAGYEVSI